MKSKNCYLFVFDGFADWEPSLLTTGLKQHTDVQVKTFSVDGEPVSSMGGLKVVPDLSLKAVSADDVSVLVLPGGTAWGTMENPTFIALINSVNKNGRVLAAICGATIFLGRLGYLNGIKHTSNHLHFLRNSGDKYEGEDWYVNKPCVSDKKIITANGTAMVDFAKAVFAGLKVLKRNDKLNSWLSFFPVSVMPKIMTVDQKMMLNPDD
jgi:putative intracellular protease/amidase